MKPGDKVDYILEGEVKLVEGDFVYINTEMGVVYVPKKKLILYEEDTRT